MNTSRCLLRIKADLLSDDTVAKIMLSDINEAISEAATNGCLPFSAQDAETAFRLLKNCRSALPVNDEGKKVLRDEHVKDQICRLLFKVPFANLRRKESRTLDTTPCESAVRETKRYKYNEQSATISKSPKSDVPVHSIDVFSMPDKNAFDGYIGNKDIVDIVKAQLDGSQARGSAFRPLMFIGPSGVGKSELAKRVARYLGHPFCFVTGSVLTKPDDIAALLNSLEAGTTVLFDEAQSLSEKAVALLLNTITNGFVDKEGRMREFLYIFATNLPGLLPDALRNRCSVMRLNAYSISELMQIVYGVAKNEGVNFENGVAEYIASRCHGIARYATDYTRDFIIEYAANDNQQIGLQAIKSFFDMRGIDGMGFTPVQRNYILMLYKGGKASAHSLAARLGENSIGEINIIIEPLLLKHGFIEIDTQGRHLTEAGNAYAKSILDSEEHGNA